MMYIEDDLDESVTSGEFQKMAPGKKNHKIVFISGNCTYNDIKKIINKRKNKIMNESEIEVGNYTNKIYIGGSIDYLKITASTSVRSFSYKIEGKTAGDILPDKEFVLYEGYHSFNTGSLDNIARELIDFEDSETEKSLIEFNNEIYRILLEHHCIKEGKEEELYEDLYELKATWLPFKEFKEWLIEDQKDCLAYIDEMKKFLTGIEVHIDAIETGIKKLLHDALKIVVL